MKDEGGRKTVKKHEGSGYRGTDMFTGKCDVRLTTKQDNALSRLAERYGVARSDVMRKALDDYVRWNEE